MKLVEILAKELDVWPEGCDAAIVTREMWEAERNSEPESWQQGDKLTVIDSVYDTHGVDTGDVVEFCRHDTNLGKSAPECYHKMLGRVWVQLENLKFSHRASALAQQEKGEMTRFDEQTPYTHRDTIIHCQAIIEDCEREIEKSTEALAKEGFELISYSVKEQDAVPDMTDWRNWKEGDLLLVITEINGHGFRIGEQVRLLKVGVGETPLQCEDIDSVDYWFLDISEVKFHSRP